MNKASRTTGQRIAAVIALGTGVAILVVLVWLLVKNLWPLVLALAGLALLVFGVLRASVNRWPRLAPLVLVSNNPYLLTPGDPFGYRTRLDGGELGVLVMAVNDSRNIPSAVERLLADPTAAVDGFYQWCAPRFHVGSGDAEVLAGIDGEALKVGTPLRFESRPGGLRVLVPPGTPREVAPPNVALHSSTFQRLWNVAHGREPDKDSV